MHRRRLALVVAVPALVTGAVVVTSGASAQAPAPSTLTFKELERGATFTHVRNTRGAGRQANSQGDLIVFTNPLADSSGKVIGRLHATCVTTVGARNFLRSTMACTGVMALRAGKLTVQVTTSPGNPTTTGAVTGGTGAYANARGVFVSKEADGGSNDTITLAG